MKSIIEISVRVLITAVIIFGLSAFIGLICFTFGMYEEKIRCFALGWAVVTTMLSCWYLFNNTQFSYSVRR